MALTTMILIAIFLIYSKNFSKKKSCLPTNFSFTIKRLSAQNSHNKQDMEKGPSDYSGSFIVTFSFQILLPSVAKYSWIGMFWVQWYFFDSPSRNTRVRIKKNKIPKIQVALFLPQSWNILLFRSFLNLADLSRPILNG